jgi:hypothetical protein
MARTESHDRGVDGNAPEPIRGRFRCTFAIGSAAVFDAFIILALFMSLAPIFVSVDSVAEHLPITAPVAFAVAIGALTLAGVLDSRRRASDDQTAGGSRSPNATP